MSKRVYNPKKQLTIGEYIEAISGQNDYSVTKVQELDDKNAYVIIDDQFEYFVQTDGKKVSVKYQGRVVELKPRITNVTITHSTNSITIGVQAERAETYKFYIGEIEGEYGDEKEEVNKSKKH